MDNFSVISIGEKIGGLRMVECNDTWFYVKSFSHGILTIMPYAGEDIVDFAKMIEKCFSESSNFFELFVKIYTRNNTISAIRLIFNDWRSTFDILDLNQKRIISRWEKRCIPDPYFEPCKTSAKEFRRIFSKGKYLARFRNNFLIIYFIDPELNTECVCLAENCDIESLRDGWAVVSSIFYEFSLVSELYLVRWHYREKDDKIVIDHIEEY